MESYLNSEDIKEEFCGVEIKEEAFFELIEESCIDGTQEESAIIKEEKVSFDQTHVQSFTSDILKEENVLENVNQIKKEVLNDSDLINDKEFIKEEEEIDYVWSEDAVKETDPLALPEIKYENEFQNTKDEEAVASVSFSESCNRKDSESLGIKVHDAKGKQHNEEIHHNLSTLSNKKLLTGERPPHVCEYASPTSSHKRKRLYKCNACEYAFYQLGNLTTHMKKHTIERPYKCNMCEFASFRLGPLKIHMEKHKGERPHKCNVCEYASFTSANLKKHLRRHTGERPYKCNVCQYASTQSGTLKMHMRRHTGELPYKCNVCEFAFSQSGNLKRHMKKHTRE